MTRVPLKSVALKVARTFPGLGTTAVIEAAPAVTMAYLPEMQMVAVHIVERWPMWINREDFAFLEPFEEDHDANELPAQPIAGAGSRARGPKPRR